MPSGETWPVGYVRLGNRDAVHVGADVAPPDPPIATIGALRLGIGYRLGHLRELGAAGGVALCHALCDAESGTALFGQLRIPLASAIDLELGGLIGSGEDHLNTGLTIAGRVHWSR